MTKRISAPLSKRLQELSGRERVVRKRIDAADRDFSAEQQRLERIEAGLAEFSKQFEVERGDCDKKQRSLEEGIQKNRELERSLRLREAENREMRDMIEQELADARDELAKERLRVTGLREKLRLEQREFEQREPDLDEDCGPIPLKKMPRRGIRTARPKRSNRTTPGHAFHIRLRPRRQHLLSETAPIAAPD